MPNGGSDCCGTCWFNSQNNEEPGYKGSEKKGAVICTIQKTRPNNECRRFGSRNCQSKTQNFRH
jgi:hypothetical protein